MTIILWYYFGGLLPEKINVRETLHLPYFKITCTVALSVILVVFGTNVSYLHLLPLLHYPYLLFTFKLSILPKFLHMNNLFYINNI